MAPLDWGTPQTGPRPGRAHVTRKPSRLQQSRLSPARRLPLSQVLRDLAEEPGAERISIGDLLAALGDRAVAALLFVFAVPNIVPTPPGASTVLGAPLLILAVQLTFGRRPWLPAVVRRQSMTRDDYRALAARITPWLERAERLLRPRWSVLALPPMEYVVGLVCLLLAIVLVLPIPLGNIPPAIAISLMALGILERDGLWVLAGLMAAATSSVVVSGVVVAMIKTASYFLDNILG